jgi:hypothetical protein
MTRRYRRKCDYVSCTTWTFCCPVSTSHTLLLFESITISVLDKLNLGSYDCCGFSLPHAVVPIHTEAVKYEAQIENQHPVSVPLQEQAGTSAGSTSSDTGRLAAGHAASDFFCLTCRLRTSTGVARSMLLRVVTGREIKYVTLSK